MITNLMLQSVLNPLDKTEQQTFLKQSLHNNGLEYYVYIQNLPFPFNDTESRFLCASNLPHSCLKNLQDGIVLKNNPLSHINTDSSALCKTFSWDKNNLSNHPDLIRLFQDFPRLYGLDLPYQNMSGSRKSSLVLLRTSHPVSMHEIEQQLFQLKQLVFSARYLIRQHLVNHYLNTTYPVLSPRQMEISRCIATGMTNKDIADCLHIKSNTVKYHITQILNKTKSSRRTSGAFKALLPDLLK